MKNMIRDAAILFAITLIAGFVLGFVYNVTKEPIAQAEEKAAKEAYAEVFQDASDFNELAIEEDTAYRSEWEEAGFAEVDVDKALEAVDTDGNGLGYVLTLTSHAGYGGDITFTLGIANDGTVNGISILSISETAGLGMRANTDEFKNQFKDRNVEKFVYTKNGAAAEDEIDALSGATVTTNAMTNGVNAGLCAFRYVKGGNE